MTELSSHQSRRTISAVALCLLLGATSSAAQRTEGVRSYEAPRRTGPVLIDGQLSEDAWGAAPWTEQFVDIRGGEAPSPTWSTRAKLMWDDEYLYVGAMLEEPHLWATLVERDAIIYHDHDFEVFLDPSGRGEGYYELEINALGTEFDLFLDKTYERGGKANIPWDMPGLRSAVHLDGTLNDASDIDRAWSVELAIPWADLRAPRATSPGLRPAPGDSWRVNFSRVQWPLVVEDGVYRKEREPENWQDHPESNWVWSPQGEIDMHIPGMWGRVRFVSESGSRTVPGDGGRR